MRIGHRQRLQHDRVHQGEDRGIRANAERERQHSRKGEAGRLAQLPYRVSKIMKKGIHSPPICKQPQTVILSEVRLSALLTISRNRRISVFVFGLLQDFGSCIHENEPCPSEVPRHFNFFAQRAERQPFRRPGG